MKKVLLTTLMTLMMCLNVFAQDYEWERPPKPSETIIGIVMDDVYQGYVDFYKDVYRVPDDHCFYYTKEEKYDMLLEKAKKAYGNKYPNLLLRNYKEEKKEVGQNGSGDISQRVMCYAHVSATIVVSEHPLKRTITKALQDVREGSRLAIDQIRITNGDKEDFKDQIVEILLDEGYKVVAKDYLEKLYEEQKAQQSGIYNERTTVQENNFSAVGYYINVKQTETAVKVQIINVSTGEYEANVTVNL